jgi:DNA primase
MASKRLLDKEEIRRQTDLAEVVAAHVQLKASGRKLRGLCPFHPEKTGSFYVDPDKGLWHCFGCKAGGDVFRFVELISGQSFVEAAQWLARRLGGEYRLSQKAPSSETARLAELNAEAAAFYRRSLFSEAGKAARSYLAKRGFDRETAVSFGLGYAPDDWENLTPLLRDKGFKAGELLQSGLCLKRTRGEGCYDRFRNRLIFPISDMQERIVAFGGRALRSQDEPKYLNSPETLLFQKSRTLYGLPWAARAIAAKSRVLIVEGYFDLIRCHLADFKEAVATLGTALTPSHLETLRRRTEKIYLAFDSDSAGLQAALRSREIVAAAGVTVLAVRLPAGDDPDTFLKSQGGEALETALTNAKPLLEIALEQILEKYAGKPERERLPVLREGADLLSELPNEAEKDFYLAWLAEKYCGPQRGNLGKVEQILLSQIRARRSPGRGAAGSKTPDNATLETLTRQVSGPSPASKLERQLLAGLLSQPEVLLQEPDLLTLEVFSDIGHRQILAAMLAVAATGEIPEAAGMSGRLEEAGLNDLLAELALSNAPWVDLAEIRKLLERLQSLHNEEKRRELALLLENEKEESERQRLQAEIHALARERSRKVGRRVVGE